MENTTRKSQLIPVLLEGLRVIQMIVFKDMRGSLQYKHPDMASADLSMLAGAIVGELFGSPNPEDKFVQFRKNNWGIIEQELLSLHTDRPALCPPITDALRIQVLCDEQEGTNASSELLIRADGLGILIKDRDIPLPSSFMALVRTLGQEHHLIIPPAQISSEQDREIVH